MRSMHQRSYRTRWLRSPIRQPVRVASALPRHTITRIIRVRCVTFLSRRKRQVRHYCLGDHTQSKGIEEKPSSNRANPKDNPRNQSPRKQTIGQLIIAARNGIAKIQNNCNTNQAGDDHAFCCTSALRGSEPRGSLTKSERNGWTFPSSNRSPRIRYK